MQADVRSDSLSELTHAEPVLHEALRLLHGLGGALRVAAVVQQLSVRAQPNDAWSQHKEHHCQQVQ